ncbi:hypothetical protein PR202_ga21573 [Eleusine coracana subsp. coracana]|uniref:RIN4 pathogenic type III effector avirulence factor Avr cleavage site domain-containing protein n=1 Tax=Eleusine coracana subsp. coracana TaxID=191504 RepID=A0AAV5D1C7_ELECO|nr:hypothetical protein PR202_ga21573 [Eleusine coracana subsp. coracana]
MQQKQNKSHVPKFGNWEKEGNVPYTLYFENARKGKGGKMINPNDPAENPEAFSSSSVAAPSPNRSSEGGGRSTPPPQHQSPNPYAREPPPRRGRASGGGGGGYSVEQSPVHPYSNKAAGDYSSESAAGYGLVANSVDRSRGKSGGGGSRGNETPTRGSAVPKFGDWDSNPASADGYTHIFNKVREEKQTQAGRSAGHGKDAGRGNGGKHHGDDGYVSSSKFSCFGWCK